MSHWSTLTTSDMSSSDVTAARNTPGGIQVGNRCWALKVGNLVYFKPAAAGAFTKSAVSAGQLSGAVYDKSLRFAHVGGKIYKYTGNDYVNIFNVTGLKDTVHLHTSPDATKLLIYSHTADSGAYDVVIKLYSEDGLSYNTVALSNEGAFKTRVG